MSTLGMLQSALVELNDQLDYVSSYNAKYVLSSLVPIKLPVDKVMFPICT